MYKHFVENALSVPIQIKHHIVVVPSNFFWNKITIKMNNYAILTNKVK